MVKTIIDYQVSQPTLSANVNGAIPLSPGVALAEIGLNVTAAINDVVIHGEVGLASGAVVAASFAVQVLRDGTVIFSEQADIATINTALNVPIIFTDVNAPVGFHAYTLRVFRILPAAASAFVIGPITLNGMLLQ